MLARLENVYLGILRVVILVGASIALLLTAWGLVSSVPQLLRWSGITEDARPSGGTLRQFIEEQRITDTRAGDLDSMSRNAESFTDPNIEEAAKAIVTYLGKRSTVTEQNLARGLQQEADQMIGQSLAYGESVRALSTELTASKGKPLSEQRVFSLLEWHKQRFASEIGARAAREAEANAKFWLQVGGAGAAFLAFILIVFVFLFVKIERSLRLVQTTRVDERMEHADHAA